jgi:hypothetical protein
MRIQLGATRVTSAAVSTRSRRTRTDGSPTRARAREVGSLSAAIAKNKKKVGLENPVRTERVRKEPTFSSEVLADGRAQDGEPVSKARVRGTARTLELKLEIPVTSFRLNFRCRRCGDCCGLG